MHTELTAHFACYLYPLGKMVEQKRHHSENLSCILVTFWPKKMWWISSSEHQSKMFQIHFCIVQSTFTWHHTFIILIQMNKVLIIPYHGQCTISSNGSYFSCTVAGGKEGLKCHTDLNTSFSLQSANAILTKQWAVTNAVYPLFHPFAIKHIYKTKNHLYLVSNVIHH